MRNDLGRRQFAMAAVGAAAAGTVEARRLEPLSPGIKISMQVGETVTDEDLTWIKQMGVDYLNVQTGKGRATLDNFLAIKKRVEAAGLKVWNISNNDNRNIEEVTLNLPGRDAEDRVAQAVHPRHSARPASATSPTRTWPTASGRARARRRAAARRHARFNQETAKGYWNGKVYERPLTHGRKYSKEELWENYTYFIKQIAPVAEEAGVRIGIHPDDPPVPELGGIPRHIFGNFDGYVEALEIANTPNIGVCLCCGTWMEGGKSMGKDVFEAARGVRQDGQAVEDPLPQRHRADSGLRRDLRRQRLHGHVEADADAGGGGLPRQPDRRSRAGDGGRPPRGLVVQHGLHPRAVPGGTAELKRG